MSFMYIRKLLKRYILIILSGLVLGALLGFLYVTMFRSYAATSSVLIHPRTSADQQRYVADPKRFVGSQTQVITGDDVLGRAVSTLEDGSTIRSLRDDLNVGGGSADDVVQLHLVNSERATARARVSAVTDAYSALAKADVEVVATGTSRAGLSRTQALTASTFGGG